MPKFYVAVGSSVASDLYITDTLIAFWGEERGNTEDKGAIGYGITGLALHPVTGVLYAVTSGNSPIHSRWLLSINVTTGAPTAIGALGHGISDISFDPSTNILYGVEAGATPAHLYTINLTTGAATAVGSTGLSNFGGALAFNDDGSVLYWVNGDTSGTPNFLDFIYTLDKATAAPTYLITTDHQVFPAAMVYKSGLLWCTPGGQGATWIDAVDPSNGHVFLGVGDAIGVTYPFTISSSDAIEYFGPSEGVEDLPLYQTLNPTTVLNWVEIPSFEQVTIESTTVLDGVESQQFLYQDSGTIRAIAVPSGTESRTLTDSNTITSIGRPSGVDTAQRVDSSTIRVITTPSGLDHVCIHTPHLQATAQARWSTDEDADARWDSILDPERFLANASVGQSNNPC